MKMRVYIDSCITTVSIKMIADVCVKFYSAHMRGKNNITLSTINFWH